MRIFTRSSCAPSTWAATHERANGRVRVGAVATPPLPAHQVPQSVFTASNTVLHFSELVARLGHWNDTLFSSALHGPPAPPTLETHCCLCADVEQPLQLML